MSDVRLAPLLFRVAVGYSPRRPVSPDERSRDVVVLAGDDVEARLVAAYMVMAARRDCVMVTSTVITEVSI